MTEVKSSGTIDLNIRKKNNRVNFQAESPREKAIENIKRLCLRDSGKYISFGVDCDGILVGAATTVKESEIVFVCINKDRKVMTITSDIKYTILKAIPANLSVLNYIWQHDRVDLLNTIKASIEADDDLEMFTPLNTYAMAGISRQNNTNKYTGGKYNKK